MGQHGPQSVYLRSALAKQNGWAESPPRIPNTPNLGERVGSPCGKRWRAESQAPLHGDATKPPTFGASPATRPANSKLGTSAHQSRAHPSDAGRKIVRSSDRAAHISRGPNADMVRLPGRWVATTGLKPYSCSRVARGAPHCIPIVGEDPFNSHTLRGPGRALRSPCRLCTCYAETAR